MANKFPLKIMLKKIYINGSIINNRIVTELRESGGGGGQLILSFPLYMPLPLYIYIYIYLIYVCRDKLAAHFSRLFCITF